MKTKAMLHREIAKAYDMIEEYPNLTITQCFKHLDAIYIYSTTFSDEPQSYELCIGIVEGTPVFSGDVVYSQDGFKFVADSVKNSKADGTLWFFNEDGCCMELVEKTRLQPLPKIVNVEIDYNTAYAYSQGETAAIDYSNMINACAKAISEINDK